MTRRIFPVGDWAPAQEAMMEGSSSNPASSASHLETGHPGPSQDQRDRSMSLSMSWRRPKSFIFGNDHQLPRQLNELAIDDNEEDVHDSNGHGHQNHHNHTSGSIKGLFRRASHSINRIVHRRPSAAADDIPEHDTRPTTSLANNQSTWNKMRQATGFRRSRSIHGLASFHHSSARDTLFEQSPHLPIPGFGNEPPIIPDNSGAAAKAAVAMQNEYYARQGMWQYPTKSDEGNDRESGIGITVTISGAGVDDDVATEMSVDQASVISKVDFISKLPTELAIHVLACLDAAALAKSSAVCRKWNSIIQNQHIWRESCLRETTTTYATSGPVMPNTGLGVPPITPTNDWKEIYRIKQDLNHRWKAGKARPVYLNGHKDSIYCLQFDEHKIITGSRDKTIRVWDMHTLECKFIIGPAEIVNEPGMLVDNLGNPVHYATGSDNERTTPSMPKLISFPTHHMASILCLQYDESLLVTGSSDSTCIVYDVRAGYRPIFRLRHHTAAVLDLAFDGKHIVTCSKDFTICIWDRQTGELLKQLRGHTGPVNAVQLRGNTVVSCSGDFRVKLWNIDTGKNIREFAGHTKGLACSQFSEDGRYIASAGNDKVIRIWNANTGECLQKMSAHDNLVRSLHIDSVSGRLVSGSYDTDIKVWDMATGHQLLDFPKWHASWVLSAKSDYRRIVSTGQDPKILIMDFGADIDGIETLQSTPTDDGGFI